MPDSEKDISEILHLFENAKKMAVKKNAPKDPENMTDAEKKAAMKDMDDLSDMIERSKASGENIISRMKRGIISKDEAKKQMKQLLSDCGSDLLANLMVHGSASKGSNLTEKRVADTMKRINEKIGK